MGGTRTVSLFSVLLLFLFLSLGEACGRMQARRSRTRAAECQVTIFGQALEIFCMEVGRYPTQEEGLAALVNAPPGTDGWNGPYLRRQALPKDPWGNQYVYRIPGVQTPYEVISPGRDRKVGTFDDVNNWDEAEPWRVADRFIFYPDEWIRGIVIRALLALIFLGGIHIIREGRREESDAEDLGPQVD